MDAVSRSRSHSRASITRALFEAMHEYALIAAPVAFYVALEAVHKQDAIYFITSPEWAIATMFLVLQGGSLYRYHITASGRILNRSFRGLLSLAGLSVTGCAAVNAYADLEAAEFNSIVLRVFLFSLTSIAFLLMTTSAILAHNTRTAAQ